MILIAGATGYVGRYLCPYLLEKGYDILALGRSEKAKQFLMENNVPFQYFDITDENSFNKLPTKNIEAIIDLSACLAEHETPVKKFFEVNTIGVYNILEFAKKNGIKKVILSSSHKLYNDIDKVNGEMISEDETISYRGDHSPYIISKIAAENFVEYYNKDFGLEGIILRFTGIHGYGEILGHLSKDGSYKKSAFEIFFEKALVGDDIHVWGDNSVKRDHIYIKDILSIIEACLVHDGVKGVFNAASGVGYSQYEEACAIAKVFATTKESSVTFEQSSMGLHRGYVYNISKAKKELNWQPQYSDIYLMLEDYKKEWISKKYHNYHFIKSSDKPKTF